jgi:hypothetical protein
VKHPSGHWGNFLLHAGMAISLSFFLLYVVMEKQGILMLHEGETRERTAPWNMEQKGVFAGDFPLPVTVKLEHVLPEFRENDSLETLSSRVTLFDIDNRAESHIISPNKSHYHWDYRMYNPNIFGHAFFLTVTELDGRTHHLLLHFPIVPNRQTASYNDFSFEQLAGTIKAKYYISADKSSMQDRDPLLVLRLVDGQHVLSELSLHRGDSGFLGTWNVKLVDVRKWSILLFDAGFGMTPVFIGFFIVMLGSMTMYTAVPRELLVRQTGLGYAIGWKVFSKYEAAYRHEYGLILSLLCGGESS